MTKYILTLFITITYLSSNAQNTTTPPQKEGEKLIIKKSERVVLRETELKENVNENEYIRENVIIHEKIASPSVKKSNTVAIKKD